MRINDIQTDGFGVWKGLTIEQLPADVTVFYGQNEAGKTTLMQFIRTMMFGFSAERQEKYVPPVYGGLAGGSIEVQTPVGSFEIQRHIDPNRIHDPEGDLAVTDTSDGSTYGRAKLNDILGNVDESIFNNVFAIGLREIQELGALNSTEASELLYKLTSGLDRVSLVDVMRDLEQRRKNIWWSDVNQPSRLHRLAEKRRQLLREIDELKAKSKRWSRIAAQSAEIAHELQDLAKRIQQRERESRLLEIAMQVTERWQTRHVLDQQILAFGTLPDPRDVNLQELEALNARIAAGRERIEQIKQQRKNLKQEAMELPINRRLWSEKARIEALTEHVPWVEALQRQVQRLKEEIAGIENMLVGEIDRLGNQLKLRAKDVRELNGRSLSALKSAARRLHEQRERLKQLQDEVDKTEFDLGQHQQRLAGSISKDGPTSLEETTRYVNRLRRRLELEQKIDKLNQARHELERDIDDIVSDQVLPVGRLSIIGVVFVLGTVLVGFGLIDALRGGQFFEAANNVGFLLMLMGAVFGFIAMGLKYHWERIAREDLEDFRHQFDVIRQQLKRAKHEREEIERQLPATISDYALELKDAEDQLARLEGLVPLEKRVHSVRSTIEDLRRRVTNQRREVEAAEQAWQEQLRAANLPETLEPLQLKELAQRNNRIGDLNFRLEQHQRELAERQKELDSIQSRIDVLLEDCGLEPSGDNLVERLNRLSTRLQQQRTLIATRKEMAAKYRQLRTRMSRCKRELDKLLGQKQRLLANVGAASEDEFRQFELKHQQRRELVARRDSLTEQIAAALGKNITESDIKALLDRYGHAGLERRWEEVNRKIEEFKEHQTHLHQQRGELLQEIKVLSEDDRLDEARLELNCLEAEIARAKREWQVLATSSQMLESIREAFELKRQPETLREASAYLEQLTEGHYTRIWTRMVGEELLCDNANDETITVDRLSRGTREAVYLSLRLALIGAYARRGAVLPLILDDVLVNFDAQRARSAARLLCEFSAKGYQLLLFTCHEHMAEIFHSLNAKVKVLPHHRDVVESNAGPTDFRVGRAVERPVVEVATAPEPEPEPKPEPIPVAVAPTPPTEPIELRPDAYDPELEFELSAIETDQRQKRLLRDELVYYSPADSTPNPNPDPIDLSVDHPLWSKPKTSVA